MSVVPFVRPPSKPPTQQRVRRWFSRWWYLLTIPAFMFGALLGMIVFAFLPGIILATMFYGGGGIDSIHQGLDIIDVLIRPGMLLGGMLASGGVAYFIHYGDPDDCRL